MFNSIKKSLPFFLLVFATQATIAQDVTLVKDINPNGSSIYSNSEKNYAAVGSNLFFVADDGTHGSELWISDGSDSGTFMIKDIVEGSSDPDIHGLVEHNGLCYFFAETPDFGKEVWSSDGTEAGTKRISDINPGSGDATFSTFEYLTSYNGSLYFEAYDGDEDNLWTIDSNDNVSMVTLPAVNFHSGITGINVMDDVLYFFRKLVFDGIVLYSYDGTQLTKIDELGLGNIITSFDDSEGMLFYAVQDGFDDILYAYDNTSNTNTQIASPDGSIHDMIAYDGKLIFSVNNDTDLYAVDNVSTNPTTTKIAETSWMFADEPRYFTEYMGKVYYYGETSDDGIHSTDGTLTGTTLEFEMDVNDMHLAANRLIISGEESFYQGEELFSYDGASVELLRDINSGNKDSDPGGFTTVGESLVFFRATTENEGSELWVYNADPVSTKNIETQFIKVYPTQVINNIQIENRSNLTSSSITFTVIDNAGRIYTTGKLAQSLQLDASDWQSGIYYISFNLNGKIETHKLVKL